MNKSKIEIDDSLKELYKKWPDIKRYLRSKGCNTADAEDLFQEALLIYSRKLNTPDFKLTVEPFHYVKNTCKFLWYNQSRKEGKFQKTEIHENFSEDESDWFQKELKLRSIELAISKIGKQCQDLLQSFYGLGMSMVDIAKKLGMRNDKVAKAQKYRCIGKVKTIVQSEHSKTSNF